VERLLKSNAKCPDSDQMSGLVSLLAAQEGTEKSRSQAANRSETPILGILATFLCLDLSRMMINP
jgi:hypothetical protein